MLVRKRSFRGTATTEPAQLDGTAPLEPGKAAMTKALGDITQQATTTTTAPTKAHA